MRRIDSVDGETLFIMAAKLIHSDKRKIRSGEYFLRK